MLKLYKKSEIAFALVWIALYVVIMNIALQFCGGFDNLSEKSVHQVLIPVICIVILAVAASFWIAKNKLREKYGLCAFKGNKKTFLYFIPLIIMSCTNLENGFTLSAPWAVSILMAINLAVGGYVEEIIFRGFLFKAMAKDNLKSAVIVSAVTFGVGHIVNLANTADVFGVLLQVCYAVVIGFLYTVIVLQGKSLIPCILSHVFVNGSSGFAAENGPFNNLAAAVFGQTTPNLTELVSAVLIILISGSYAVWLWKKA